MAFDMMGAMQALPAIAEAVPQVVEQAASAQANLERIATALEKIANNTAVIADYLVMGGTMPDVEDIEPPKQPDISETQHWIDPDLLKAGNTENQ